MKLVRYALAGAALLTATPAAAQTLPFARTGMDRAEAEYHALVLGQVREVVQEWVDALNAHDAEKAAGFYAVDARAQTASGLVEGREAVEASLRRWLPGVDEVRIGLLDFDASGRMAYGALRIQIFDAPGSAPQEGTTTLVLKRTGRDWEIRAQTVLLN